MLLRENCLPLCTDIPRLSYLLQLRSPIDNAVASCITQVDSTRQHKFAQLVKVLNLK